MEGCVFCKIGRGEIPSSKVYEDENVLAFLDIAPIKKGHTLVIPKEHHETITDVPDILLQEVIVSVKSIAMAVMRATGAGGINLTLSMHDVAGQTVPHAHFHIIPRHEGDGLRHWPQGKYEEGERDEYAEKIRSALDGDGGDDRAEQ
ncbi:HIT family protein [Candidatus Woesearchaeota archaeon]|nr:HIT family protein [Candidatus Woesearchaeota archaeon]